ncbi:hypothetical protein FIBSPDRAFT_724700 [Athelia psychrophila]|uniref:GRIP domain-containing protein n=1 Tax=Athelia psychrophila TaxID=1759441 RepID=A0A166U350_9AGAM|nr:hypothetical protein FIBSPDRAFT_724700 [Fibularhizoctonia sp. CBS 109695]
MDRQELVRNAVAFLADPTAQASSLTQKIQFLEAKGLTAPEIEDALRQSGSNPTVRPYQAPYQAPYGQNYGTSSFANGSKQWDWRDYFITTVVAGTAVIGAVTLFQKYLLPNLRPPATTAYEADRDALTAQFDVAEALLKEIQAETAAVKSAVEEQKERVDKATEDVQAVVKEMRDGETKTRDEMRELRDEVNNVRDMLPKMIDKNRDSQTQSLAELQQELKSLKALLLSRGSTTSHAPTPSLPSFTGRPSIPAWQLSGSTPAGGAHGSAFSSASPLSTPPPPEPPVESKGKEVTAEASGRGTPRTMFSQFRQAVEGFQAPPPQRRNGSQDLSRSASPAPGSPLTKSNSMPEPRAPKSNLEDRLRAKLAAAERKSSTPAPVPVPERPLSPKSVPLPGSPALSPTVASASEIDGPLSLSIPSIITEPSTADLKPEEDEMFHSALPPITPIAEEEKTELVPERDDAKEGSDSKAPLSSETKIATTEASTASIESPTQNAGGPSAFTADDAAVEEDAPLETVSTPPEVSVEASSEIPLEALQNRLKLVEQRFADVSTSFKRIQAEKLAADAVLREFSPVETMQDVEGLRNYLENLNLKTEMSQDEIKRLNGKLERQEERIEELRETHHLESTSQSDQVEKLRQQLKESEALISAANDTSAQSEGETSKRNAEIERLKGDVTKANGLAKEEEEKRVKAISLLKTLRQKLVKAEKDKEDVGKEMAAMKERGDTEREKERTERTRMQREIEAVEAERDKALAGLKARFDKDLSGLKERHEKETTALRGQLELDAVTTKSLHVKELTAKNSQIASLQNSVNSLTKEKNSLFDELQMRQAELESSTSHLESLQGQNTELQFQLREFDDRIAVLNEEVNDTRRQQTDSPRVPTASAEDVARLLSSSEVKYESKLAELRKNLAAVEKERNEGEADWSRKLREKSRETDELRRVLQSSSQTRDESEEVLGGLKAEIEQLRAEITGYQRQISALQMQVDEVKETEVSSHLRLSESKARLTALEQHVEEGKARETQLRTHNKTLREEMRKVQSSAALLEKQRNPGVGYWTSRPNGSSTDTRTSISSNSSAPPSRPATPKAAPAQSNNEEEVNLEYLRNVILQFLEHKEMRPNLVKVLSIILHFTPQETRRIIAKV